MSSFLSNEDKKLKQFVDEIEKKLKVMPIEDREIRMKQIESLWNVPEISEKVIEETIVEPKMIEKEELERTCDVPGCTKIAAKSRRKCTFHRRESPQKIQRKCDYEGCERYALMQRKKCGIHFKLSK
jgi:inorganic pyrophosphatase